MIMVKKMMFLLMLTGLIIGGVSATPISVGGGWTLAYIPSGSVPVPSDNNPFTYAYSGITHVTVTDYDCIGDVFSVYDNQVLLGTTSPVLSEYPDCQHVHDVDVAYADSRYSHGCFNVPASPTGAAHSLEVYAVQKWIDSDFSEAYLEVDSGPCPGTPVPEFPSAFLPAAMIIGFLGAVLLIQRTRKQ